ncbi:MAG: gamma-glutamyl-gamma-aminobutyrate hydrolase family protein [Ilumatobacteraceae bacterium]
MRALLVANADDGDPGFVGHHLRKQGYAFTELVREHPGEWPSLDGADVVVLLGSDWSVYWPDVATSVAAESALVRDATERGTPVFAICYGSQLVAHALGGAVARVAIPEIGWVDVDSDVADIAAGPWLEWHADVVTVPPAATELARNAAGPQAWRLGRILCTQFHPEATETILARWSAGGRDALVDVGTSRQQLMAETRANVGASRKHAERLTDWFLDHVAGV